MKILLYTNNADLMNTKIGVIDLIMRIGDIDMITSKDVAKLAGVSHTTVSRAFRENSNIKKETRDRIMKIANEIGYSPNTIASNLRSRKSNTICFIISYGFNPLFLEITKFIECELAKHGYHLLISFDDGDSDRQWNIMQSLSSAQVYAIIFTPLVRNEEEYERMESFMKHSDIHFLQLFSTIFPNETSLYFDDNYGAYVGTRYLLSKGHKNILLIGGHNRVEGYEKAYMDLNISLPYLYKDLSGNDEKDSYNKIMSAIMEQKPTAVFPVSDSLSFITYQILTELDYKIPDDISFLSFDDEHWMQLLNISVISHPIQALGNAVVREILSYQDTEASNYPSSTIFKPFLIERKSVKII